MAADNQVALARIQRSNAGNMSRATRQAVPPFLQKLYEMVSDSATDDLIKWSDTGDSFFVLDHERVAHDVLPRWFKHSNFASFVRQLNMYGFRKVQHLQQGVLRSESETELWNFEHPNFHRGQPDLLCLISRKKQASERHEDTQTDGREALNPAGAGAVLDINNIITNLSSIKRHQTTISADLNDLKASNQHLWQEAIAARERHKKHQDTINRILKFLAGVFGNSTATHTGTPAEAAPHAVIPRKRQRLMIENKQQLKGKSAEMAEIDGPPIKSSTSRLSEADDGDVITSSRFATVDTPSSILEPPSPSTVAAMTPLLEDDHWFKSVQSTSPAIKPTDIFQPAESATSSSYFESPAVVHRPDTTNAVPSNSNGTLAMSAVTPSSHVMSNQDEVLQALLSSPSQLQRLLSALTSQATFPLTAPSDVAQDLANSTSAHQDQYHNEYLPDHPPFSQPNDHQPPGIDPHAMQMMSHRTEESVHLGKLQMTREGAERIEANVATVSADIDSLMDTLGLSHEAFYDITTPAAQRIAEGSPVIRPNLDAPPPAAPDFDFDAFLNQIRHQDDDPPTFDFNENLQPIPLADGPVVPPSREEMSAFLDEVVSQSDGSSPAPTRISLDEPSRPAAAELPQMEEKKARKRKSSVAEVTDDIRITNDATSAGAKAKRKR